MPVAYHRGFLGSKLFTKCVAASLSVLERLKGKFIDFKTKEMFYEKGLLSASHECLPS